MCSLCTSVLFPNSGFFFFFFTNTLNSLSGNLFISVSLNFRDFLLLSIESHFSAFSFWFTFSAFMNLKYLPLVISKGWSYVVVFLYRLHVPKAFGGKTGFDVDTVYLFPESVLAALILVGDRTGDGSARADVWCEAGLFSGHHCPMESGVWPQVAQAETLRIRPKLALFL